MLPIPPAVRVWLPVLVLGLGAVDALSTAIQILVALPELPLLSLPFFAGAGLLALGAWGVHGEAFWARGFAIGALFSSGVGGIFYAGVGLGLPAGLVSLLILLSDDAPGRFEQRASFRRLSRLTREGARRIFLVALGLGLGLPALLASPLALVLFPVAPIPAALAALLAVAALFGLMRLASWSFFAAGGALVALVVAIAMGLGAMGLSASVASTVSGPTVIGAVALVGLALAVAPLVRPVLRALRAPR